MSYRPFITSCQDIDLLILYAVNVDYLIELRLVNKYVNCLITNKNFWVNRIKHNNPKVPKSLKIAHDAIIQSLETNKIPNNLLANCGGLFCFFSRRTATIDFNFKSFKGLSDKVIVDIIIWVINTSGKFPDSELMIEDINLELFQLIIEKCNLIKHINPKSVIIAGRADILDYLNRKYSDDTNNPDYLDGANYAAGHGYLNILKILPAKYFPDKNGCNLAIKNNQIDAIDWCFERNIYPDYEGIILLIERNEAKLIKKLPIAEIRSNSAYFSTAIKFNKEKVVTLFLENNIKPTKDDYNCVVEKGNLKLLQLFCRHNIFPTRKHADLAIAYGRFEILEWMEIGGILPSINAVNELYGSSSKHTKKMIQHLEDKDIYPTLEGIKLAMVAKQSNNFACLLNNVSPDKINDFSEQFYQLLTKFDVIY